MLSILLVIISQLQPLVQYRGPDVLDSIAKSKIEMALKGKVFSSVDYKSWTFIGPQPIYGEHWSGGGYVSGRVTSIAVDPTNPHIVYLTGAQGGVWKTVDGGLHWTPLTDGLPTLAAGYITIDPDDHNILYFGTGELHYSGDCYYGDGLYKSVDGGSSWQKIATTEEVGSYIAKVVVLPGNPDVILVASNIGLVISQDGGTSWNTILGYNDCNDIEVNPSNPDIMYAAIMSNGIYRSTDRGFTWTKLTDGLPTGGFGRLELAISPSNPSVLYASFTSMATYGLLGLYKTIDGGDTWTQLTNTPDYLRPQGFYDHCIIVDPSNSNIVYAGGVFPYNFNYHGLVMTTDGGASWTDITVASDGSRLHPDMQALAIGSDGTLWVGNDGGIWKTTSPGATWINLNATLGITQFYTLAIHPTYRDSILGGTQDNGTPMYSGSLIWNEISGGDGGPCAFDWYDPSYFFTSYVQLRNIYKYHNGYYLDDIAGPWVTSGDRASWANGPFVIDPHNHNVLYVGTYRVWKSVNYGNSWRVISDDLTSTSNGVLLSLVVSPSNPDVIYTGSSDGFMFKTSDGGATWTRIGGGFFRGKRINDIVINPYNDQEIYAVINAVSGWRILKSTNGGVRWTSVTGSLPAGLEGLSLAVDFTKNPHIIYVGTNYGVYYSTDDGTSWNPAAMPHLAVYELKIDTANNFIVAATHGRGMWRAPLVTTEVAEHTLDPYTHVALQYLRKGSVILRGLNPEVTYTLKIYSVSGRLLRENIISDRRVFIIDGNLNSGIYFARLTTSGQGRTFKFEVLK